jgi:hypothetical protein
VPGKRTRRSLTNSPCRGKVLAGERGRVIAWTWIDLNTPPGYASAGFAPQPPQFGLQRIQLGTGNGDQVGCFDAHQRLPQFGALTLKSRWTSPRGSARQYGKDVYSDPPQREVADTPLRRDQVLVRAWRKGSGPPMPSDGPHAMTGPAQCSYSGSPSGPYSCSRALAQWAAKSGCLPSVSVNPYSSYKLQVARARPVLAMMPGSAASAATARPR